MRPRGPRGGRRAGAVLRHRPRLPAPARGARRRARGVAGPGPRHERVAAGVRLPPGDPARARRPRGRRGAHLRPRPPAAAPARNGGAARPRRGRRHGRRTPSARRARPGASRGCSTRSRTSRTPPGRPCRRQARALVEVCDEFGVLVLEDDPYGKLRFEGEALPGLAELAEPGRVIFTSSFSKTVAPGLRVGYMVSPPEIAGRLAAAASRTYISPALLAEAAVHRLVTEVTFPATSHGSPSSCASAATR